MESIVQSYEKFHLDSTSETWDGEYDRFQIIPSTTRQLPSKALVLFSELLNFDHGLSVLDAGCGNGRNSVYLAQKGCRVEALDFSTSALHRTRALATEMGVASSISTRLGNLHEPVRFSDDTFDLTLDSYVFCHFTDEGLKRHYWRELRRVTKPNGLLLSLVFCTDDEYYQEIFDKNPNRSKIVVDSNNGVTKQLYSEEQIKKFFLQRLNLQYFVKFQFYDVVLERRYLRSILALVLQK
jgi:SAM-dependent methyltransferase